MSAVQGLVIALLAVTASAAFGDLVSEEVRNRLDMLPHHLLRLAARRMPTEVRDDHLREWQGELAEILRGAEALPITRVVRGLRYAAGLLRVAPTISGILARRTERSYRVAERSRQLAGQFRRLLAGIAWVSTVAHGSSPRQRLGAVVVALVGGGFTGIGVLAGAFTALLSLIVIVVGILSGVGIVSLSRPPLQQRAWQVADNRERPVSRA